MKTTKSSVKSEKKGKIKEPKKGKKNSSNNPAHLEEDIRQKANEIYLQRLERGESGTPENDWIEAEKYLTEPAR